MNTGFYGRDINGREIENLCLPRFSTDAVQRLYCGQSVTTINLQLAYWMGFFRVVLIGMDFSYKIPSDATRKDNLIQSNSDDPNHFHPDYFGKGKTVEGSETGSRARQLCASPRDVCRRWPRDRERDRRRRAGIVPTDAVARSVGRFFKMTVDLRTKLVEEHMFKQWNMLKPAFLCTFVYGGTAIFFVLVFFLLHYLGNQFSPERGFRVISEAFERNNMVTHDYPIRVYGPRSVRSLIGQDQFTDCEILGSVLTPPSIYVKDAIVLETINLRTGKGMCRTLLDVVSAYKENRISENEYEMKRMKERYWWGSKALVSIALQIGMDIFQLNMMIKVFTYFSYLCFCLVAFWHSIRLFVILVPFIVFGFLFSGIPYYGGFAYSMPYLLSMFALISLIVLVKTNTQSSILRMFFSLQVCYPLICTFLMEVS